MNQIKSYVTIDPALIESKEPEKIIGSITEKLKVPFKMRHGGPKYKEIAEILDLKPGTVKSRIFCARKILMNRFTIRAIKYL
jgi:RNA polymerase sigma-70 factor (ECF subfamily)